MIATHYRTNLFFFCPSISPGLCLGLLISGYHQVSDTYLKIIMSEQEHCHVSAIKISLWLNLNHRISEQTDDDSYHGEKCHNF